MRRRLRYWWQKQTDPYWMWGHPDDWTDAEWFYWERERR